MPIKRPFELYDLMIPANPKTHETAVLVSKPFLFKPAATVAQTLVPPANPAVMVGGKPIDEGHRATTQNASALKPAHNDIIPPPGLRPTSGPISPPPGLRPTSDPFTKDSSCGSLLRQPLATRGKSSHVQRLRELRGIHNVPPAVPVAPAPSPKTVIVARAAVPAHPAAKRAKPTGSLSGSGNRSPWYAPLQPPTNVPLSPPKWYTSGVLRSKEHERTIPRPRALSLELSRSSIAAPPRGDRENVRDGLSLLAPVTKRPGVTHSRLPHPAPALVLMR